MGRPEVTTAGGIARRTIGKIGRDRDYWRWRSAINNMIRLSGGC